MAKVKNGGIVTDIAKKKGGVTKNNAKKSNGKTIASTPNRKEVLTNIAKRKREPIVFAETEGKFGRDEIENVSAVYNNTPLNLVVTTCSVCEYLSALAFFPNRLRLDVCVAGTFFWPTVEIPKNQIEAIRTSEKGSSVDILIKRQRDTVSIRSDADGRDITAYLNNWLKTNDN